MTFAANFTLRLTAIVPRSWDLYFDVFFEDLHAALDLQVEKISKNGSQKVVFEKSAQKNQHLTFSLKWPILTFAPLSDRNHQSIEIILFLIKTFKKKLFNRKYLPDHLEYTEK